MLFLFIMLVFGFGMYAGFRFFVYMIMNERIESPVRYKNGIYEISVRRIDDQL